MGENPQQVTQWLDWIFTYGSGWVYVVLLLACFIENIFPPFPGDSFIVAAGVLVAMNRVDMLLSSALIVIGGLSSVIFMYFLGRRFGRDYFMRKNFRYFPATDIIRFERSLNRWGAVLMIFSRFIVGFRSAIAVGAGIGCYAPVRMVIYSFISYILFGGMLMALGYTLAQNYERIAFYFQAYNMIAWPVIIALLGSLIVWRISKARGKA